MDKKREQVLRETMEREDANAFTRKKDHIELAFQSQISQLHIDPRFQYEPLLAGHPKEGSLPNISFLGKTLRAPMWVSSMTGGTALAHTINHNLARACKEFGFGMGLGSCRSLLYTNETLNDFNIRKLIGDDLPLYANLGIAQVEQLIHNGQIQLITELLDKLSADGLIIHINPLQEWLQPEGDRIEHPPIETITRLLEKKDLNIIVKEVGQGMGYQSLEALFQLPLQAIDFAANGGTNFAKVELLRAANHIKAMYEPLAQIGHNAEEMTNFTNEIIHSLGNKALCKQVIISGGIQNFLDGYYLINKLNVPSIYGQASAFLKHARESYELLAQFVEMQIKGLELANAFLRLKK